MNHSILFDACGETAAQAATAALERRSFRVVRSFDLRSALAAHADCKCPHHGTAQCACQFVVLLVYGEAGDPLVVTAHSREAQAQVQIVRPSRGLYDDATTRPDPRLAERAMAALVEAALTLQSAPLEAVAVDASPA